MKEKHSPLSRVFHQASSTTSDSQTEKESLANEAAEKYWQTVIRQTSQDETTSSSAKEEQTNDSQ